MHDPDNMQEPPFPMPFGMPHGSPFKSRKEAELAVRVVDILAWAPGALAKKVARTWLSEMRRNRRAMILEPNRYSDIKVERYLFIVNAKIDTLGKEQSIEGSNSPDVNFRPQRITSNVSDANMVMIYDGRVANVSFTVGGIADAWQWNPQATDQELDLPTLTPANKASFSGRYTGRVPASLTDMAEKGQPFEFTLSFTGPATICA